MSCMSGSVNRDQNTRIFEMTGYVYKITNTIDSREYIGIKSSPWEKTTSYMGGGELLKYYQMWLGLDFFRKEKISEGNTSELLAIEKRLVNQEYINRRDTYNVSLGGKKRSGNHTFCQEKQVEMELITNLKIFGNYYELKDKVSNFDLNYASRMAKKKRHDEYMISHFQKLVDDTFTQVCL